MTKKIDKLNQESATKTKIKIVSFSRLNKIIIIFSSFIGLLLISYYSYVIGYLNKEIKIISHFLLSKDIYINSNMKDDLVIYKSEKDLSNFKLVSKHCKIDSKFIYKKDDFYVFYFKFLDDECKNPLLHLEKEDEIIPSSYFDLDIKNDFELLNKFTDYKTDKLKKIKKTLVSKITELNTFSKASLSGAINIDFLQKNRQLKEAIYLKDKINYILEGRKQTYLIPVLGYNLPKDDRNGRNQIPNAGRPYRADTTDGIHHGWDIVAPLYTPVRSLSDGIIIRVVKGFKYEDLEKIKTSSGLTYDEKMKNLDIFRGNQVWLKTLKGDVVFYSHLDSIEENIKEGMLIEANKIIGKIGITGVPDKNYKNYHLHFEIAVNPKIESKAGNYKFEDIINWSYVGKGMKPKEIFELQDKMFKK